MILVRLTETNYTQKILAVIQFKILISPPVFQIFKLRYAKTVILPFVLYEYETWSLTLREDHRLRVLRIFESKWEEIVGDWRRLHNGELHIFHDSSDIKVIKSRRMRWERYVTRMGELRNAYHIYRKT